MDKKLVFVAKYYHRGSLDVKRAYRRTLDKAGRRHSSASIWAVAAAVAVLVIAGAALLYNATQAAKTTIAATNANRIVTLADGTLVTLAPRSSIAYDDGNCREVELSGKAYFEIMHDAANPFVIHDNDYIIRDIGTRLTVDEKDLGGGQKVTSVFVAEGSVSLTPTQGTKGVIVASGDMYVIGSGWASPRKANTSRSGNIQTAWATHEFHFDNTPLPDVLSDLEAYYHVSLTCDAPTQKRLTADFHADSLNTITSLIEQSLGVRITISKQMTKQQI